LAVNVHSQSKSVPNHLVSGTYEQIRLSCDSTNQSFTGLIEDKEGMTSCRLFFKGKMVRNKEGQYVITAYPYYNKANPSYGTLLFITDHKNHGADIKLRLNESGSCQNIIQLKDGWSFSFENQFSYQKFSMICSKKAPVYVDPNGVNKKGYFVEGDIISILSENEHFCYVEYWEKQSYKAWIKKSDIIL